MCPTHPQEVLALFCETCDKLTCRDCQLVAHRDHRYKFAHEKVDETRSQLDGLLKDITYKRALLTSAMKVILDRQNDINDKKKDLMKEITTTMLQITAAINSRAKQLVIRLTEVRALPVDIVH